MVIPALVIAAPEAVAPSLEGAAAQSWLDLDGAPRAFSRSSQGNYVLDVPGLGTFAYAKDPDIVTVFPAPSVSHARLVDYYHRVLLTVILLNRGWEVLHASAVVVPSGVVAFCAHSGTGKSTIAYGLSQRGHTLYADDAVAFERVGTRIPTFPLPFSTRLHPTSARFFDLPLDAGSVDDKYAVTDTATPKERLPLVAVFILERVDHLDDGAKLETKKLSPGRAVRNLVAHAYYNLEDQERQKSMMRHYMEAAVHLPVVHLRVLSGLGYLHNVLDEIERIACSAF